jgi:hypothetical protein
LRVSKPPRAVIRVFGRSGPSKALWSTAFCRLHPADVTDRGAIAAVAAEAWADDLVSK